MEEKNLKKLLGGQRKEFQHYVKKLIERSEKNFNRLWKPIVKMQKEGENQLDYIRSLKSRFPLSRE